MIGLAHAAMSLAERRKIKCGNLAENHFGNKAPIDRRGRYDLWLYPVSEEYYRIIDRITHGEKP